ncbi:MAG: phosphoribosylglycinamide formyltransferase [Phycisphaerales bacterium]|nr:MAG: phosphoribosylglycinamide formyltransferase [Phycisphaerales bacterium]
MSDGKLQLAVLISGTGRSLVNMQERIAAGTLDAKIKLVISSRGDVAGVDRARELGLETVIIERRGLSAEEFQQKLTNTLVEANPDLICMAGFLSLWHIPDDFHGRVINIHPALLPDFGGKGMYGHHVHEAVLRAGKVVSGCSVHFCDNEYDHGPVILQRQVPVKPGDTPDDLAARVFEQECIAYPEAIQLFADGRVKLDGLTVTVS